MNTALLVFALFVRFLVVFRTSSTGYAKMYVSLQISLSVCGVVCVSARLSTTVHGRRLQVIIIFLVVAPALRSKICILLAPCVGI